MHNRMAKETKRRKWASRALGIKEGMQHILHDQVDTEGNGAVRKTKGTAWLETLQHKNNQMSFVDWSVRLRYLLLPVIKTVEESGLLLLIPIMAVGNDAKTVLPKNCSQIDSATVSCSFFRPGRHVLINE